jgi:hypothetical protein
MADDADRKRVRPVADSGGAEVHRSGRDPEGVEIYETGDPGIVASDARIIEDDSANAGADRHGGSDPTPVRPVHDDGAAGVGAHMRDTVHHDHTTTPALVWITWPVI